MGSELLQFLEKTRLVFSESVGWGLRGFKADYAFAFTYLWCIWPAFHTAMLQPLVSLFALGRFIPVSDVFILRHDLRHDHFCIAVQRPPQVLLLWENSLCTSLLQLRCHDLFDAVYSNRPLWIGSYGSVFLYNVFTVFKASRRYVFSSFSYESVTFLKILRVAIKTLWQTFIIYTELHE